MKTAIPARKQLDFQDWELGLFLHFGIRTFHEGHRDWDGKKLQPEKFNPAQLDCNQWVETAKKAGVNYIVLTAKHHDGFANWPTRVSSFSVTATPWKNGKGDVVKDFTDACHRHGVKAGLYYSPADWTSPIYKNPKEYDNFLLQQLNELLGGYGEISVLWFDGCGSENHPYDWQRIVPEIRKLQPNIMIFNMGDPDYRWVGNEAGIAPVACWNTVEAPPWNTPTITPIDKDHPRWLPAECDCMMTSNWFYSDTNEQSIKTLDELMGMYCYSAGRGCNLLLNIGPDRRGLLPDKEAARLLEFGAEIRRRFARPIASLENVMTDSYIEYKSETPMLIDHVVIQEDLAAGEHCRRFAIKATPAPYGLEQITLFEGYSIGHKVICPIPPIKVLRVRLEIIESDGPVKIRSLQFHNSTAR